MGRFLHVSIYLHVRVNVCTKTEKYVQGSDLNDAWFTERAQGGPAFYITSFESSHFARVGIRLIQNAHTSARPY